MTPNPRILAIRTDFIHHGEDFGYKQILKFIRPFIVLGINERSAEKVATLRKKYQWLFEWDAFRLRKKIDLVHILYGEDYYRWSGFLFKSVPVVATFHQPPEILEREVFKGDIRGRVGSITHRLSKGRFRKLAAAIVTNPSQAEVLKKVMPQEKIHFIPLGIHIDALNRKFQEDLQSTARRTGKTVITVGNWMRDWDFYLQVVEASPGLQFHLVDRKISSSLLEQLKNYKNLSFYPDLGDEALFELYLKADLQFLPVMGIAGSNAFLQGLALGCPTLLTGFGNAKGQQDTAFIKHYKKGDVDACIRTMKSITELPPEESRQLRMAANAYANGFSWQSVAERTQELYRNLISKK